MGFIVGIAGGIGSGKTAASDYFEDLGLCVVDADFCARKPVEKGQPALNTIAQHFGEGILLASGELNRAKLREIIFANPEEKTWLENLLHPLIAQELQNQLQQANSDYVILVSPLLIESGQYQLCDRVLVVDVPEDLQMQRVQARDDNDIEQIKRIMQSQATREQRLAKADDVVVNDQSLEHLHQALAKLHQHYLQLAKEKTP